jgi:pyrimidine operon attenuation protein/uracil phosphoribosyltransferase
MTDAENTKVKGVMLDKEAIRRTLARMAHEIVERNDNLGSVVLLGIKTRGVPLASRIRQMIKNFENVTLECGALDVSDFRDDTVIKNEPSLPKFDFDIVGKDIILVDDVLFTGRTVRAGIEAIMEVGVRTAFSLPFSWTEDTESFRSERISSVKTYPLLTPKK